MAYFGGLVVLLTIIGIVKKYDARLVLLVAGTLMAFAGDSWAAWLRLLIKLWCMVP